MTLSASACEFMILLQESLLRGSECLQHHLFTLHWQQVIQELDQLIFDTVCSDRLRTPINAVTQLPNLLYTSLMKARHLGNILFQLLL